MYIKGCFYFEVVNLYETKDAFWYSLQQFALFKNLTSLSLNTEQPMSNYLSTLYESKFLKSNKQKPLGYISKNLNAFEISIFSTSDRSPLAK